MLLPTRHPLIRVEADDREVTARFADRRWVFPAKTACCCRSPTQPPSCLPGTSPASSAMRLPLAWGVAPEVVRVEVDETYGQWAACELRDP